MGRGGKWMGEDFERRKGGRINGSSLLLEEKNRDVNSISKWKPHNISMFRFQGSSKNSVLGDKLLHTTDSTKLSRRNT